MGKTEVACYLSDKTSGRVMFVAHLDNLVHQAAERFNKYGMNPYILQANQVTHTHRIIVASKPTLMRRLDETRFLQSIELLIIDEAHLSVEQSMSIIAACKKARVLCLTATPYTMDGGGLGRIAQTIAESMSATQAIAEGWKTPTVYYSVKKDIRVKKSGSDFDKDELHKFLKQSAIADNPVGNWLKYAKGLQTIVFCANIPHAHETSREFRSHGIPAAVVHSVRKDVALEPLNERGKPETTDEILRRFKAGEFLVVVNVAMLTIGSDFPQCRCVLVNTATMSRANWKQMNRSDRLGVPVSDEMGVLGRLDAIKKSSKPYSVCIDMGANVWRHGKFEDPDYFTLSGIDKKDRQPRLKNCVRCLAVIPFNASHCDHCGQEQPQEEQAGESKERKVKKKDAILERVNDVSKPLPKFLDCSIPVNSLSKADLERLYFITDAQINEIAAARRKSNPRWGKHLSFIGDGITWEIQVRERKAKAREILVQTPTDEKDLYKMLIKEWHPDTSEHPNATAMSQLINMYKTNITMLKRIQREGAQILV